MIEGEPIYLTSTDIDTHFIKFMLEDGKLYTLSFQPDITAYETSLIYKMIFLSLGTGPQFCLYDYAGYIKKHGLERHFVEERPK